MTAIFIRDFPEDVHHKAKIQAAVERITLKDLIAKALRWYLTEAEALDMAGGPVDEGGGSMLVSRQDIIELFGTDNIAEIKGMVREHAKLIEKGKKALKSGTPDGEEADRKEG
ncbi:MAG: hypothetical protein ACLQVJ_17120 [Syntrophobacteraceae bacterium]